MVVVALHQDVWTAYDATDCRMYRVWDGDVKFTGSVYDTLHGPQPSIQGQVKIEGVVSDLPTWEAQIGDQVFPAEAEWRGYIFRDGGVYLQYDVKLADGRVVRVEERPEVMHDGKKATGIERTFAASDMPADVRIGVLTPIRDEAGERLDFDVAMGDADLDVNFDINNDVAMRTVIMPGRPTTVRTRFE